jgi:hypothetical protein
MKKEVTHFMDPGHWFLSLYNDDGDAQEVSFVAVISEDMTQNCPNGCSGKGECLLGHCQCNPGFGGDDCSESMFRIIFISLFLNSFSLGISAHMVLSLIIS